MSILNAFWLLYLVACAHSSPSPNLTNTAAAPKPRVVHKKSAVPERAAIFVGEPKAGTTHIWNCMVAAFEQYEKQGIKFGKKEKFLFGKGMPADPRERNLHFKKHFDENPSSYYLDFTPDYLLMPGVRDQIHERFPDAKIGISIRDPMTRAYSHFKMFKAWKWDNGYGHAPFEEVVRLQREELCACEPRLCTGRPEDILQIENRTAVLETCFQSGWQGYIHYSLPALAILHWLEKFPPSQVTVVRFAHLTDMGAIKLISFLQNFTGLSFSEAELRKVALYPQNYKLACAASTRANSFSDLKRGKLVRKDGLQLRDIDATDYVLSLFPNLTVV